MNEATKHLLPLLRYLVNGTEFNQTEFNAHCNELERGWKTAQFPHTSTVSEVLDYYNKWVNKECPDDPTIQNTELYLFLRYFIVVCALDSYGRCETSEGMKAALERGRQHLRGVFVSLQRMEPWKVFLDAYDGSPKPLIDWILNVEHPTWFTKLSNIDIEQEKEIRETWRAILKDAL